MSGNTDAQCAAHVRQGLVTSLGLGERYSAYEEILEYLLTAALEGEVTRVTLRRAFESIGIKYLGPDNRTCLPKLCFECSDPIYESVFPLDEPERCVPCLDKAGECVDPLDCIKQEAYAAGFENGQEWSRE